MNRSCLIKEVNNNPQGGFAILEALIAMFIFTVGILGVFSMQTTAMKTTSLSRGITEQSAIAAGLVERLMPLSYTHADLTPNITFTNPNQGRYAISWRVAEDALITNTKTITVTVAWSDRGQQKTINLTYIKTNAI
ncbi:MAG: prepilin-type N-terminal cleavage/methylation domain-containing protein [Pseudomonadota bacterium]